MVDAAGYEGEWHGNRRLAHTIFKQTYKQQAQVIPICIMCVVVLVLCLSPCHHQACVVKGCYYNLN